MLLSNQPLITAFLVDLVPSRTPFVFDTEYGFETFLRKRINEHALSGATA